MFLIKSNISIMSDIVELHANVDSLIECYKNPNENNLKIIRHLMEPRNMRSIDYFKLLLQFKRAGTTALFNKHWDELMQYDSVKKFFDLYIHAKMNDIRDTCLLCLTEDVIHLKMRCGHKICFMCYKPYMDCYFRFCNNPN